MANGFHTAHEVTETIPHNFGEVTERLRRTAAPLSRTPAPNAPLAPWPAGAATSNKPWWEGANGAPVATHPAASFAGSGQAGIGRPGQGSAPSGSGGIGPRTLWPGRTAFRIPQPHPVPDEIQKSFLLWMSVAALTVLGLLINLISAAVSGTAFDGSAIIDLLIGALLAFGAAHIRLGHTWARPLNAGLAFVLTLVLMKVIAVLVVVFALYIGVIASGYAVGAPFPFLAAGVALIVSIGALGLIVAATVLMHRAPANRYLVARRAG